MPTRINTERGGGSPDERHRDGVHAVVGLIDQEPPEFHVELAVDSQRFALKNEQLFEGYRARRRFVPRTWLERVTVREMGWRDWYEPVPRREEWP